MTTVILPMLVLDILMVTAYQPKPEQTKPECQSLHHCTTSTGENVFYGGVAVSQDLLCPQCLKLHARCKLHTPGKLHYGDYVWIQGFNHPFKVNDVMNKRHTKSLDVFVETYEQEKAIAPHNRMVWKLLQPVKRDEQELAYAGSYGEGWR